MLPNLSSFKEKENFLLSTVGVNAKVVKLEMMAPGLCLTVPSPTAVRMHLYTSVHQLGNSAVSKQLTNLNHIPICSHSYTFSGHINIKPPRTSLVVRWLRIHLLMQGTRVWSLVQDNSTCCQATKPVHHERSHWNAKPVYHPLESTAFTFCN